MVEVKVDYIVDVSALIPNFITEIYTENAQELFRQLAHGEVNSVSPNWQNRMSECVLETGSV